jgi:small subunit ribosomal protein S8
MSMQDTTADMLTRIRNSLKAKQKEVIVHYSRLNFALAELLVKEGYLMHARETVGSNKKYLTIILKYFRGEQAIETLQKISKSSCRVYTSAKDMPRVYRGLGIAVISTSSGLMTDREARSRNLGGEIICQVV